MFFVLRFLSEGMAKLSPVLVIALLALILNTGANYVLMYEAFGAPRLGAQGCGWATALTFWSMAIGLGTFIVCNRGYRA